LIHLRDKVLRSLTEVGGVIDAVTPDFVSNAAAGVINGTTFGGASAAFDIDAWCGASGYGLGTLLAPGPAKFLKGFSVLGINKTVRVDRTGKPSLSPKSWVPSSEIRDKPCTRREISCIRSSVFEGRRLHRTGAQSSRGSVVRQMR
jgi:hypothetical protein